MSDLIEALKIFMKYGNPAYPFHCEHDILYVCGIEPNDVSERDMRKLDDLGFFIGTEQDGFISYKYGSA